MDTSGFGSKVVKQRSHQQVSHQQIKEGTIKFKKQFSRVSTGATMSSNSHHRH